MSKHFLPSAEFLFDKISTIENADYSPFVVQYCRALENELLKKLFESYHAYLKEVKSEEEIEALASPHLEKRDTCTRFATLVRKDDPKYTMGDMQFIMNMMKPTGSTFKKSLLLQDFYEFILSYYRKNILEKEYLALIERITQEYRNKSAHPYIIALDQAQECRKLIQLGLNQLFESRKVK